MFFRRVPLLAHPAVHGVLVRSSEELTALGYGRFAGDSCLEESAAIPLESEIGLNIVVSCRVQVANAFEFVVAGLGECSHGTSGNAFAAGAFAPEKAIRVVGVVRSRGRRNVEAGYNRSHADGVSLGRDQPITEAKSPEPRRMSRMALRPRGSEDILQTLFYLPIRPERRGHRVDSTFLEFCDQDEITQLRKYPDFRADPSYQQHFQKKSYDADYEQFEILSHTASFSSLLIGIRVWRRSGNTAW